METKFINNIGNAIKSIEIETTNEGSFLKVKDLLGRVKLVPITTLVIQHTVETYFKSLEGYEENSTKVLVSGNGGFSWQTPNTSGFSNGFSNGFN